MESRGESNSCQWVVVKNTPVQRTPLLKAFLAERFPEMEFRYFRFVRGSLEKEQSFKKESVCGLIAELKSVEKAEFDLFDNLYRQFKDVPIIFILSPQSYELLKQRRPAKLSSASIVISEFKSIDYVYQLPRLIEDISLKRKLIQENHFLQKMVERRLSHTKERRASSPPDGGPCTGLRVQLKNLKDLKQQLGREAPQMIISETSAYLSQVIRSSDQILKSKENEFLVFLSNVSSQQIENCSRRIEKTLKNFRLQMNRKHLKLPFRVTPVQSNS